MTIGQFQLGLGPRPKIPVIIDVELEDEGKPFVGAVPIQPLEVSPSTGGGIGSVTIEAGPINVNLISDVAVEVS